ncbi:MAG: peptidylprolyl isomerase [Deltaproteobacteria bacterium]|nr:peptidylprolyl isomerase [Deltaproteobacteria bacterium]
MEPKVRRFFCGLAVVSILVGAGFSVAEDERLPSEKKVAVVDGSAITEEQLDTEMSRVRQMFASRGRHLSDSQLSAIRKQVLESLINRELLYRESQRRAIRVDQTAVDKEMGNLRKGFSSEAEFKSALSQMNLGEDTLRSQIEREMAIQQLIDGQVSGKITVSEKECREYYDSHPRFFRRPEQVRASHILVKVDPRAGEAQKAEARRKIESIQEKLRKGGDFAALAKEFSQGPSAPRGGDLNYFKRGDMAKPFEDAAFALKPGEVSDIVETRFGYHIIKVTGRKPETTIAYDDVREKIEAFLRSEKTQQETKRYIERLRQKAEVQRFLQ